MRFVGKAGAVWLAGVAGSDLSFRHDARHALRLLMSLRLLPLHLSMPAARGAADQRAQRAKKQARCVHAWRLKGVIEKGRGYQAGKKPSIER